MNQKFRLAAAIIIGLVVSTTPQNINAGTPVFPGRLLSKPSCEANGTINSITFSPDNHYILTSWNDGEARVWDIKTGKVVKILAQAPVDVAISSVGFSPDDKIAFTANRNNVVIWDVATWTERQVLNLTSDGSEGVEATFINGGQQIFTGEIDGARLWDVSTGKLLYYFPGEIDRGNGQHFQHSPDGSYLFLKDQYPATQTSLWNVQTRSRIRTFDDPRAAFSPDNKSLIASDYNVDQQVETYQLDIPTNKIVKILPQLLGEVVTYSPDGKYLVTGQDSPYSVSELDLWDAQSIVQLHTFYSASPDVVTFSPDSKRLLFELSDDDFQTAKIAGWDIPAKQTIGPWSYVLGPNGIPEALYYSNDGQYVLIAAGNTLRLLNPRTGEQIRQFC